MLNQLFLLSFFKTHLTLKSDSSTIILYFENDTGVHQRPIFENRLFHFDFSIDVQLNDVRRVDSIGTFASKSLCARQQMQSIELVDMVN